MFYQGTILRERIIANALIDFLVRNVTATTQPTVSVSRLTNVAALRLKDLKKGWPWSDRRLLEPEQYSRGPLHNLNNGELRGKGSCAEPKAPNPVAAFYCYKARFADMNAPLIMTYHIARDSRQH